MFPKLPPLPPSPLAGLRKVIREGQAQIHKATEDIHSLTTELRGGEAPRQAEVEPLAEPSEASKIAEGTACNICSSEHFSQAAGDLSEAMRFARESGLTHPEVIRRVEHARQELNQMERYDLSPAEIQKLSGIDRALAEWALPHSRSLRHLINQAITSKEVGDLEKAAAQAESIALEFAQRLWHNPPAKECPQCGELKNLLNSLKKR